MIKLIKNELIKMFLTIRTLIVFIGITGLVFGLYLSQKSIEENTLKNIKPEIRLKAILDKRYYVEGEIYAIKANPDLTEVQKKYKIESYVKDLDNLDLEEKYTLKTSDMGIYSEEEKIRLNEYEKDYLKENITVNPARTDELKVELKRMDEVIKKGYYTETLGYNNGASFIYNYLSVLGSNLLFIIAVIYGADILVKEYTGNRIERLSRAPISTIKIYTAKIFSLFLMVFIMVYIPMIIGFAVISYLRGGGPLDLPMIIANRISIVPYNDINIFNPLLNSTYIVPLSTLLITGTLVQLFFLLVLCCFMMLVQIYFKDFIKSFVFVILFGVVTALSQKALPTLSRYYSHLFFTSFSNPLQVFDTRQASYFINQNISFPIGIIVLLVTLIVFYIIGAKLFKDNGLLHKYETLNEKSHAPKNDIKDI